MFDGIKEFGYQPKQLSGVEVLNQTSGFDGFKFGKHMKKRKQVEINQGNNWLKRSIFFKLPYWNTLLLRHNLDPIHIEKNVCDSVLGTLMNIPGKSKDNLNSRLDLKALGLRKDLHPIDKGDKVCLPNALYTMSNEEKRIFCEFLKNIKVLDGHSLNIGRCVNLKERKVLGLKSHDCHVLLECFLPLGVRGLLFPNVRDAIIELCTFFRELCSKVLTMKKLDQLESQIAITLCKLEMIFPPSFFDVMMHLPIHLASEAKIAGPVQYHWMYPIER